MSLESRLRAVAPGALAAGRAAAHRAVQPLSLAARANLAGPPDDSHSNLGWDAGRKALVSHPLDATGRWRASLCFSPLSLRLEGPKSSALPLDGCGPAEAAAWLDARLAAAGLKPASTATAPYALPAAVEAVGRYRGDGEMEALAAWFDLAEAALSRIAAAQAALRPGPGPVRLWPHHFDIATYVALEVGDPETARGIGVGLSLGDESHASPYFYVNPWPAPAPASLPSAPAPGRWSTEGFVGAVATSEALLAEADPVAALDGFLAEAYGLGRVALGV